MSKQNKWAGNFGKQASGGSATKGGNGSGGVSRVAAPVSKSSKSQNVINMKTGPGENNGNRNSSTHNDINAFTRGIKSRGPYTGPSFSSMNNSKAFMQETDSQLRSAANNPSASGNRLSVGADNASVRPPRQAGSGPVGGPSFSSFNNTEKAYQGSTSSISSFNLPSGASSRRGSIDGSGTGMTKAPVRTGSGKAPGTRTSGTKDNKNGSGYQASVR